MKRIACMLLCILIGASLLPTQASAYNSFDLGQLYDYSILAGGIYDLYAFPEGNYDDYTYQWQVDVGIGTGNWTDLEDNTDPYGYCGTDTYHLQLITAMGNGMTIGTGWEKIPFRCLVTNKKTGISRSTASIYMEIYASDDLPEYLETLGFGLYEPSVLGADKLKTADYSLYTATAPAGTQLEFLCGCFRPGNDHLLRRSDATEEVEIWITENGKTVKGSNDVYYTPYTIGKNAVTVEFKLHHTLGIHDLGYYEAKTLQLTTAEPTVVAYGTAKSQISLLKEQYNQAQKLASISKGTRLKVTQKGAGWCQVVYGGYVGYVATSSLNLEDVADTTIPHVDLTIQEPVVGETPDYSPVFQTANCGLYHTEPVTWYDKTESRFMRTGETFRKDHQYRVQIWATATNGYRFQVDGSYDCDVSAIINGNLPCQVYTAYEQDPEKVIEIVYDFNAPKVHSCSPEKVQRVAPTCTAPGKEAYYRCSCGKTYSDAAGENPVNISTWGILPATGHSPSTWRTTGIYHYKACTTCGEFLEQEDHYGGTATCSQKGKCTACGYAYIEETENHTPDTSKWIARIDMYHFHPCKLCGAHCDIEEHKWSPKYHAVNAGGHAYQCADCMGYDKVIPHTPGPEATDTDPQTCKDCGYILQPAKNHKHDLAKVPQVPADCINGGNIEYYFCTGCNDCFTDSEGKHKIPETMSVLLEPLGHEAADSWEMDESYHWRSCKNCREVLDETKMLHEAGQSCPTCGYTPGMELPTEDPEPQSTAAPTQAATVTEEDAPKKSSWMIPVLIALVCFGASVTAAVIIRKKKK